MAGNRNIKQRGLLRSRLEGGREKDKKRRLKTARIIGLVIIPAVLLLFLGRIDIFEVDVFDKRAVTDGPENPPSENEPGQQNEELAKLFREKLKLYQNEIKPQIEALNLSAWAAEKQTALDIKEESVIQDFSSGRFTAALKKVEELTVAIEQLKRQHAEAFKSHLEKARMEFAADRFDPALRAIDTALLYRPRDSASLKLKGRITVMGKMRELLDAANVARAENRLDQEMLLLNQAIQLDPEHIDVVKRHNQLVEQKRERDFDVTIKEGWTALRQKNLGQAKRHLNSAAKIFPQRKEISLLSDEIQQAEYDLAYQALMREAAKAEDHDDWINTELHYSRALEIFPEAEEAAGGFAFARTLNRQVHSLKQALLHPERLSDDRIFNATMQLIEASRKFEKRSPGLKRLLAQLSQTAARMSTPVKVTVHSDNKTHISLLRVGVIGKVMEYSLKAGLKPGKYVFKGKRKGFKEKLVEVEIQHGKEVHVTVICDEPV